MRILTVLSFPILACVMIPCIVTGQDGPAAMGLEPEPISLADQYMLSRVPLLELPEEYKGPNAPLVPVSVDNSSQPYFRPITTQSGYECGQSAGIAFNFTYEIDRLRGLPANNPNNQYPTHFTWNFLNSGYNYTGASFFDSWEIVRACGNMNVTDYGGSLNFGGEKRWISGYDAYYNGMKNRLTSVKAIRVDTPEGLQTLKYWLWDHLEGSAVGGVANIYAKYFSTTPTVLPAGTPEEGKFVQTNWGSSPSHAWTICGYNDSIRFDYNNDGQYTNNIDITGDGNIDMHDWEIGGLKFANGYAGTWWCNQGFCYLMYKTLADDIGSGGIWEHTVYVVDVKESCDPKLTMKVSLKHTSRDMLKVTVGMSTNLSATVPEYIYEYPIFNHQGGPYYMQGGTSEADKTIEFGLDLTHILSQLTPGQMAKYFLQVDEFDVGNYFPGEIVQMSLIDYTGSTPLTIACPSTNVNLVNNGITRVSVNHNATFSKPSITSSSLPTALLYQPYACQLMASGGVPPYQWDVQLEYPESITTSAFPMVTSQQLTLTNTNTGYAIQTLDFPFPFYQQVVNTLYIYADGHILFDDLPYTYPYLVDANLLFHQTPIISPFMTDLRIYPAVGDGIWYEGDANSATIRWNASINGQGSSTDLNFAVKFYPNGLIEYYYGNMNYPAGTQWTGGLSGGDNKNYQYSQLHNASTITSGTKSTLTACGYPVEMKISESGLFSGTPQNTYFNQPIKFRVTDNNGISNTKTLTFTTNGLQVGYSIVSGGDSLIEYGETAHVSFSLTNLGTQPVTGVETWVTETDPYIMLVDSVQYVGTINGGQTLNFPDAFTFEVSSLIPNLHEFLLQFHEISNQQNFQTTIHLEALAPDLMIGEIQLLDGDNGLLDPGEFTDMIVEFDNHGGASIQNLNVTLTSGDILLTVNQGTGNIPILAADSSSQLTFQISASGLAPFEHLYLLHAALTGNLGYAGSDSLWLLSGEIIEDFETGNFQKFNWLLAGDAGWTIDQSDPYEGQYITRSGPILDGMESEMAVSMNVLTSDEISFWKRVSCEDDPNGTDFDYLAFYIDNIVMGKWDGNTPWERVSYPVSKGYHTFKWVYHKDYSVSTFADATYLDFITFPPFEGALPEIFVDPAAMTKTLDPGQTATEPLEITNIGGGILTYTVQVFDTSTAKLKEGDNLVGSTLSCSASSFVPGQTFSWIFTLHNASPDNESLRNLRIDFPAGMTVTDATNFSGGSLGDLLFDGTTGAGATINWHGETGGGFGVIQPGESATAAVNGTIEPGSPSDVIMVYVIEGDQAGSPSHVADEIRVPNEGLANEWLSLSTNTGSLWNGQSETLTVTFSTEYISSGGHYCDLLVRDPFNNITVIPVHLHVNWPVWNPGTGGTGSPLLSCYPNPFTDVTRIHYRLEEAMFLKLEVYNMQGHRVSTLVNSRQEAGEHEIVWEGRDEEGNNLPSGVYSLRISTPLTSKSVKLIRIR